MPPVESGRIQGRPRTAAQLTGPGGEAVALGTIETFYDHQRDDLTDSPRYPQLGLDTALIWLLTEAKEKGWRLLIWEDMSDQVPEEARRFTIGARVALGGDRFVPAPAVVYADEVLDTFTS